MERVLELFAGAVEPPLSASEASALHAPAACLVKIGGSAGVRACLRSPASFLASPLCEQRLVLDALLLLLGRDVQAVVRFRLGEQESLNALLMGLLACALGSSRLPSLLPIARRIIRLVALSACADVSPAELKTFLAFLRRPSAVTVSLLQALDAMLLGEQTGPPSFFVLTGGAGLVARRVPSAVLAKDLHVRFWFRAEALGSGPCCLFACVNGSKVGLRVLLSEDCALSVALASEADREELVALPGARLALRTWHHLSVSVARPKYLLLTSDELRVCVDGVQALQRSVRVHRGKDLVGRALEMRLGAGLVGQMGAVLVFGEVLSAAAEDALYRSRGDNADLERDVTTAHAENRSPAALPPLLAALSPARVRRGVAVDLHGGLSALLMPGAFAWTVRGARAALGTLGGIACTLPLFPRLFIENETCRARARQEDPHPRNVGFGVGLASEDFAYAGLEEQARSELSVGGAREGCVGLCVSVLARLLRGDEAGQREAVRLSAVDMVVYALAHVHADLFRAEDERCVEAVALLLDACADNASLAASVVRGLLVNADIWGKASEELQRRLVALVVSAALDEQYSVSLLVTVEVVVRQLYACCANAMAGLSTPRRFGSADEYTDSAEVSRAAVLSARLRVTRSFRSGQSEGSASSRKVRSVSHPDLGRAEAGFAKKKLALRLFNLDQDESEQDGEAKEPPSPGPRRSPRSRTPTNAHLERVVQESEEAQRRGEEHRAHMRRMWRFLPLLQADRHGLALRDIEALLAFVGGCDDLAAVAEVADLLLFLVVRKGQPVVSLLGLACKSPEAFASFVLFKLVARPKEAVRSTGIRLLAHYFVRLDANVSLAFKFPLSGKKEGIELFDYFNGIALLSILVHRNIQDATELTYCALLELLLLRHGSRKPSVAVPNIADVELRPESSFVVPAFDLQPGCVEAEGTVNACVLPALLEAVVFMPSESHKRILRDLCLILQSSAGARDAWLGCAHWHVFMFRFASNLIRIEKETDATVTATELFGLLEMSARSSGSVELASLAEGRRPSTGSSAPRKTTSFLNSLYYAKSLLGLDSGLTHEELAASHESLSFCMEIYCTLAMHAMDVHKRSKEVAVVLEHARGCRNGYGVGLTVLSYVLSKAQFNIARKTLAVNSAPETFSFQERRGSRMRLAAVLSLLSVTMFFTQSDIGWAQRLKEGASFSLVDYTECDFDCSWTYLTLATPLSKALLASEEELPKHQVLERLLFLSDDQIMPPGEISGKEEARLVAIVLALRVFDSIFWLDDKASMSDVGVVQMLRKAGMFTETSYSNIVESVVIMGLSLMHDLFPFSFIGIKNLRRLRFLLKGSSASDFHGTAGVNWLPHMLAQTALLLARLKHSLTPLLDRLGIIANPVSLADHSDNVYILYNASKDPNVTEIIESMFDSEFGGRFYDVVFHSLYLLIAIVDKDPSLSDSLGNDSYDLLTTLVQEMRTTFSYSETEFAAPPSPSSTKTNKRFFGSAEEESSSDDSAHSWDWMRTNNSSHRESRLRVTDIVPLLQCLCDISLSKTFFSYSDIFYSRLMIEGERSSAALFDGSTRKKTDLRAFDGSNKISRREVPEFSVAAQRGAEMLPLWNACLNFFDGSWSPWFVGEESQIRYELTRHRDRFLRRMVFTRALHSRSYEDAAYCNRVGMILRQHSDTEGSDALTLHASEITEEVLGAQLDFFQPSADGAKKVEGWGDDVLKTLTAQSARPTRSRASINSSMFAGSAPGSIELETKPEWILSFEWGSGERQILTCTANLVTLEKTYSGTLLLTNKHLFYHPRAITGGVILEPLDARVSTRRWVLECLCETFARRYLLKNCGVELLFTDEAEVFIAFENLKELQNFFYHLRRQNVPRLVSPAVLNPRLVCAQQPYTEMWINRQISNFSYLIILNTMAGRSFNDLSQYPVFPWIIADYKSATLDLNNPATFRDLSKPIGAVNENKLKSVMERYNEFEDLGVPQFMYGSHYSSAGIVLQYLIRQEPFTSMAVKFQGGKFDVPDRIFHSIGRTWDSLMSSISDVKELIPEFFFLPEMFLNSNHLPLGDFQNDSQKVDDVVLPPWAKDPFDFVFQHREALESEHVSANLHLWIDLIFGHKQTKEAAIEAKNVFYYLTYENAIDIDAIKDPLEKEATICQVINFGQTPSQLFVTPHLSRRPRNEFQYHFRSDTVSTLVRFTPSKQGVNECALQPVVALGTCGERMLTVHADGVVCSYKWVAPAESLSALSLHVVFEKARRLDINPRKLRFSADYEWPVSRESSSSSMEDVPAEFALACDHVAASVSDGRVFTCRYWDNALRLHSLDSLKETCSAVSGHAGEITCVAQDRRGGSTVVTGGADGTCRVWVAESPGILLSFYDELRPAATDSGQYDSALVCLHVLCGHQCAIVAMHYSADNDLLVSCSEDGLVCLHGVRKGLFIRALFGSPAGAPSGPTGPTNVHSGPTGPTNAHSSPTNVVHIVSQGIIVAHSWAERKVRSFWINGNVLATADVAHRVLCFASNSMSDLLVCGLASGTLLFLNYKSLKTVRSIEWSQHGSLTTLSYSQDNNFLLIGAEDGSFSVCTTSNCSRL